MAIPTAAVTLCLLVLVLVLLSALVLATTTTTTTTHAHVATLSEHPETELTVSSAEPTTATKPYLSLTTPHESFKRGDLPTKVFSAFDRLVKPWAARLLRAHGLDLAEPSHHERLNVKHHMVPMRDGVRLSTFVIRLRGNDTNTPTTSEKKATVLASSPYAPTSDQVADVFIATNDYVAVVQDQRGTFLSEGTFTMWHSAAADGKDTIDWIVSQPWSNGNVFTVGISADGCASLAVLLEQPKPLKAQLLQWASADGHETTFPGGAFREGLITGWMTVQAPLTHGTSLRETLPDVLKQDKISEWWAPVQGPGRWGMVQWTTIHLAGQFDIFQGHQIYSFEGIRSSTPKSLDHTLILGPLGHCLIASTDPELDVVELEALEMGYGYAGEVFARKNGKPLAAPKHGKTFTDRLDRVNLYLMGSRKEARRGAGKVGHFWTSLPDWPAARVHRLYLTSGNRLVMAPVVVSSNNNRRLRTASTDPDAPHADEPVPRDSDVAKQIGEGSVEFSYDPANPVITHGGNNFVLAMLGFGCGSEPQNRHERRPDVLTFDLMEPLKEPLPLVGHVRAVLFVSTNRNDTDFHVTLTDVHPDGSSMLIRNGLRRMRYRRSTPTQTIISAVRPGVVTRVEVDLWFAAYVVAPNHRLRVAVTGSNTPYWAKNANSGSETDALGFKDLQVSHSKIHFAPEHPSFVEIPVVSMEQLPRNKEFGVGVR